MLSTTPHGPFIVCGGRDDVAWGSGKSRPVSASICPKISKVATGCSGRFLKAATSERAIGQLRQAPSDYLLIGGIDVNFQRFAEIGEHRSPPLRPSRG
jgi:hypothetical protein